MLDCGVSLAPYNLLDNSDFRNPVNQGGKSSYDGAIYGIDRWKGYSTKQSLLVRSTNITVSATGTSYIGTTQKVENMSKLAGKTITFAAKVWSSVVPCIRFTDAERISLKNVDGTAQADQTLVLTYTVPSDATSDSVIPTILCRSTASGDYIRIYWAVLYEGSYTVETLPAYQPKGYAAELAECQRYYYQTWDGAKPSSGAKIPGIQIRNAIAASRLVNVEFPVAMRIKPTITLYTSDFIEGAVRNWNNSSDTVTDVIAVYGSTKGFVPGKEASNFTNGAPYSFHYSASADL